MKQINSKASSSWPLNYYTIYTYYKFEQKKKIGYFANAKKKKKFRKKLNA